MKFLSLFSGIGGLDLGLEWAGWECVGQVENDKFCQAVLQKHWPDVPKWWDIQSVEARDLPQCDAIVGGFPCQDISVAGKGAGLEGSRSGLWWEMYRLVCQVRPKVVLIENVAALRTKGSDTVFNAMEEAGYTGEPYVVGAKHAGATQKRERVFYVAYSNSVHGAVSPIQTGHSLVAPVPRLQEPGGDSAVGVAHSARPRKQPWQARWRVISQPGVALGNTNCSGLERRRAPHFAFPNGRNLPQYEWERARTAECRMGITANGLPFRLAQRGVGNAVVPQVAYCIGTAINGVPLAYEAN